MINFNKFSIQIYMFLFPAPRYYSNHNVLPSGWNYPIAPQPPSNEQHSPNVTTNSNSGDSGVNESSASSASSSNTAQPSSSLQMPVSIDLAVAPAHYMFNYIHHKPAVGSSSNSKQPTFTEKIASQDARDSQLYALEELRSTGKRPQSLDMPSLISMEILESHGKALASCETPQNHLEPFNQSAMMDQTEVQNRIAEMGHILQSAEKYLTKLNNNNSGPTINGDCSALSFPVPEYATVTKKHDPEPPIVPPHPQSMVNTLQHQQANAFNAEPTLNRKSIVHL